MKLTPDLRHHIEVQYLASWGLLDAVMDRWVKKPMYSDRAFNYYLTDDYATFLYRAFLWGSLSGELPFWRSVNSDINELINTIQNETDT